MGIKKEQVWFITGASKGFGLALTQRLLAMGHKVAATSRDKANIEAELGIDRCGLLSITVDLTDESAVKAAIENTVKHFGRIDVVVNNAGYMLLGSLEEVSADEFSRSMSLNVFAFLHVIRNVLLHFRARQGGHIFNYSSSAGYGGDACAGSYNAVKAAIIGMSEALAKEVAPFNIHVTIVSPGLFRTNLLGKGSFDIAAHKVEAYPTGQLVQAMDSYNGKQPGSPEKLASIVVGTAAMTDPPLHLVLGHDAYSRAENYYKARISELEANKAQSLSTDFD